MFIKNVRDDGNRLWNENIYATRRYTATYTWILDECGKADNDVATGLAVELKNYVDIVEMIATQTVRFSQIFMRFRVYAATLQELPIVGNYSFLFLHNTDITKNRETSHVAGKE